MSTDKLIEELDNKETLEEFFKRVATTVFCSDFGKVKKEAICYIIAEYETYKAALSKQEAPTFSEDVESQIKVLDRDIRELTKNIED